MLTKLLPKRSEDGFTLLELLIVVIVIGILAAIALPVFLSNQAAAYDASAQSDVRNTTGQIVGWNALNRGTPVLSAEGYVAAGGKLTVSPHSYVGLSVSEDGSYNVCGYNTKGNKYSAYNKAWAFNSETGKSGASTAECVNAYHVRDDANDASGDSAGSDTSLLTTVPGSNGGSVVILAKDPNGKYTAGGDNPTTGDPSTDPGTGTTPPGGSTNTNTITAASIYPLGDGGDGGPRLGFQYNYGKPCCTWDVSPYIFGGQIYNENVPATGTYDSPDLNSLDGLTPNTASRTQTIPAANYDIYYGTKNYSTGKIEDQVKVDTNSKSDCTFTYGTSGSTVNATISCPFDPNTTNGSDAANMFASEKAGNGGDIYGLVVKFKANDVNGVAKDNALQLTPQIEVN